MQFTLTVPADWNFTPADLMRAFAYKNQNRYHATRDRYFCNVLFDRVTKKYYCYDHLDRKLNQNHTEIVTVFLTEKEVTQ